MGINWDDFSASKGSALLDVRGTLVFQGECLFSVDTTVLVLDSAELNIGKFVGVGNGVKIKAYTSVFIGNCTRLAVECQVFDTNFHYVINKKTGEIFNNTAPIHIGAKCWIGNRSSVMKGTNLPDGCIVASNSLLNKDYVARGVEPNSVLAGLPAKKVGESSARIFSLKREQQLQTFFKQHPDAVSYQDAPDAEDNIEDIAYYFSQYR